MSYPRYPQYKDTGVEWLGDVPAHWQVKRTKYVCQINPSRSEIGNLPAELPVSFVPMECIGEGGSLALKETRSIGQLDGGYTYFCDDDVLIAKITPCFENGKGALCAGLVNGIGLGTTELHVLRVKNEALPKFIFYLTRSSIFHERGTAAMYGAAGQQRVPSDFVSEFPTPLPLLSEQQGIVAFLDRETARIDTLIAKQEEMIALLQEKRKAIISHAVTCGLDPDVPLKDSGVEGLGEIPQHWGRTRVKRVLWRIIDTEHKTAPFYSDGEYLVVRTSNVKNGKLDLGDAKYTDAAGYQEWTARGVPEPGDIIFTREAPAGEACIVPSSQKLCIGQRTVLFKLDQDLIDNNFMLWSIYGGLASEYIRNLSQGSTVSHINMSDIAIPSPIT